MISRIDCAKEIIGRHKAKLMDLQSIVDQNEKEIERAKERLSNAKLQYDDFLRNNSQKEYE